MSLSGKPSLLTLYSNIVSISALPLYLPSALPLFFFTTLSPSAGYKTHDAFTIYFSHHGVTPRKEALFSVLAIAAPRAEAGHIGVQQMFNENANMAAAYLGWGAVLVVLRTGAHALIWSSEWSLMALVHFLLFQRRILGSLREVKKFSQAGGFQSCLPMHSAILLCWPPASFLRLLSEHLLCQRSGPSLLPKDTLFILHCKALLGSLHLRRKWDESQVPGVLFISGYWSWSDSLNLFLHPKQRTWEVPQTARKEAQSWHGFSNHRWRDWRMKCSVSLEWHISRSL